MDYPTKTECPTGIYKITNKETGTTYIGQTSIDLIGRWRSHIGALEKQKHRNPYLQRSWNKHGAEAFVASVVEYIPVVEDKEFWYSLLDEQERAILKQYPNHYNLMEAGEDRWIFSEESKARASYSAKNRKITQEQKQVWEEKRLAAIRTLSSRQKRSESHKKFWSDSENHAKMVAKYNSEEVQKKKSENIKKSFTEERRQKYSKMNETRWQDEEFRKRTIESVTSSRNSPENAEKYSSGISRGWLKRKADPNYERKNQERIAKIKATKAKNRSQ